MEIKFTIKIKDEQNPPVFNESLGKGVLQTIVVEFKGYPKEQLENDIAIHDQINSLKEQFMKEWVEVTTEVI